MISHSTIGKLLIGFLVLPIALLVLLGVAGILWGMGDQTGAQWLVRLIALGAAAWLVDLACLVAAVALKQAGAADETDELEPPTQ